MLEQEQLQWNLKLAFFHSELEVFKNVTNNKIQINFLHMQFSVCFWNYWKTVMETVIFWHKIY